MEIICIAQYAHGMQCMHLKLQVVCFQDQNRPETSSLPIYREKLFIVK